MEQSFANSVLLDDYIKNGGIEAWDSLFSSTPLLGVPFVLLGHFFAEKTDWIKGHISNLKCALLLLGVIIVVAEFVVCINNNCGHIRKLNLENFMKKTTIDENDVSFIFAGYSDELMQSMFKDILNSANVKIIKNFLPFTPYINGLLRGLAMRFYKYRVFQYGLYLLEKIYRPLEKIKAGSSKTYLIFTNAASIGVSVPYLKSYLKRHAESTLVMLFLDPLDRYWAQYAKFLVEQIPQFKCFTFEPQDAIHAGFKHTMNVYSYHKAEQGGTEADIYFSFFGLDRLDKVRELGNYLEGKQVRCNFVYVGNIGKKEQEIGLVKNVEQRIPYSEILKDAAQANCLLEILRPGQTGATLRYYEAICYNKKLLTTNKNVVNLPFYNPQYIKVFETLSDVDYEWVRRCEPVDYHYDGSFSPIHFLEEVSEKDLLHKSCEN